MGRDRKRRRYCMCLEAAAKPVLLLLVADEVDALRGQFVVEVGVRQAWPFLTFCDNKLTPPLETRLYIHTTFHVGTGATVFGDGDPDAALAALLELNNRTVTDASVGDASELRLTFDHGAVLSVDSEPSAFTSHDIWWLGKPESA
jgi:hypothetical protein